MIPAGYYPGAPEGLVLAKIKSLDYEVSDFSDASYRCDHKHNGNGFFLPKPPDGITYSAEQLAELDKILAFFGEELLPLDANLGA